MTLSPQEEKTIARKPTENLEAYDYYLRGRSYARRFDLDFALQMFEQAIKLDSNFALAHAGIATIYGMIYQFREQDQGWIEKGLAACERALARCRASRGRTLGSAQCTSRSPGAREAQRAAPDPTPTVCRRGDPP